jgi:hypothetical protein
MHLHAGFLYNPNHGHKSDPITQPQVTPEILALFDITKPTMPRAFNALERFSREDILVDDPGAPTHGMIEIGVTTAEPGGVAPRRIQYP